MRLIDADSLIEETKGMFCPDGFKLDFIRKIDNAPIVEYPFYQEAYQTGYEEGKNERPQGEWIFDERGYFYCDKCGKYPHDQYATTDFCPNCGAKMIHQEVQV